MIRRIGLALFGIIVAIALIAVVQMIGHNLYPPPPGTDFEDPAAVRALIEQAPVGALLFVIASYVIGTFGGGFIAGLIGRDAPSMHAMIVGGFVLAGTFLNLVSIPHPVWFQITALGSVIVTAFLTARITNSLTAGRQT